MPITIIAITGLAYWGRFDQYVFLLLIDFLMSMLMVGDSLQVHLGRRHDSAHDYFIIQARW